MFTQEQVEYLNRLYPEIVADRGYVDAGHPVRDWLRRCARVRHAGIA